MRVSEKILRKKIYQIYVNGITIGGNIIKITERFNEIITSILDQHSQPLVAFLSILP